MTKVSLLLALAALLVLPAQPNLAAQTPVTPRPAATVQPMPLGIFVGSERERYLRVLQTLGTVPLYPWSIRGFSPAELDRLRPTTDDHPWAGTRQFAAEIQPNGVQQAVLPVDGSAKYNSAFPFGMNDGPVWAGRGLTLSVQGGAGIRQGPFSVVVAPQVFGTQNQEFRLIPTGHGGNLQFADPMYPLHVDYPQRFGDGAYVRFDVGQSTARIDWRGLAFGASTANQWWGPMTEYPFILGNNAPGFTHVFIGSATPLNVWIGRLHARVVYGGLSQSDYSSVSGRAAKRFASSAVALFSPRGIPGLEIGAGRFFHTIWPDTGIGARELRRPFQALLKLALPTSDEHGPENQLASVFARWVAPRGGFEVYGEFGREDHSGDTRDLLQEPDHTGTYGFGVQKAWTARSGNVFALRGEVINFEPSLLLRHRGEGGTYVHGDRGQGHTHRGQLLGAGVGVGSGAAATVRLERYTRNGGSDLVSFSRLVRLENENLNATTTRCADSCLDVQYVVRAERSRQRGALDVRYRLGVVYELNRQMRRDEFNLNPEIEVRWHP